TVKIYYCCYLYNRSGSIRTLHSFPTRRSSDLRAPRRARALPRWHVPGDRGHAVRGSRPASASRCDRTHRIAALTHKRRRRPLARSEEHTSELQSRENLVCRLLLEKKK